MHIIKSSIYQRAAWSNESHPIVGDFVLGVTSPHFYPWELGDMTVPRMRAINSGLSHCALAVELLHRAAYRQQGLGMSEYAPDHMVGSTRERGLLGA